MAHRDSADDRPDENADDTADDEGSAPFRWGVSASSVSAEGVAPGADWSSWERSQRVPPSHDGAGFGTEHSDDLGQFAALGCTDWRLTVEWARVEPVGGKPDSDALDLYREMLGEARAAGLRSWVTLHHGSLPGWYLDDEGGHRDATARNRSWARHVDRMAEELDDLVDGWIPIDDPVGWALRSYLLGSRPPGRSDPAAAHEAIHGAVLALHEAVRLLGSGRQPVVTAWRADPVHAAPEGDGRIPPETEVAARRWDELLWSTWLIAHREGILDLPGRAETEVPALRDQVSAVGLVHDHPVGVGPDGTLRAWPATAPRAVDGFAPEPDELAEAIGRASEQIPDHDLMVVGHGVPTTDEQWRDEQLSAALDHVVTAARESRLVGYFHDSGIDGYEWSLGFSAPRGLIGRDRVPKPAAATFRAHAAAR